MRTVVTDHELGEYLRVDEISRRFDVSVDDVLAACSVLGFDAHDASSLIEFELFSDAVMHVPVHPHDTDRRTSLIMRVRIGAAATAAVLVAVLGLSLAARDRTPTASNRQFTAAAYRAKLKSTYDDALSDSPAAPDYRALAQQLAKITPPVGLAAEHAHLVSDAQSVAALSSATTTCATTPNDSTCVTDALASAPAAAVTALQDDVAQLEGSPTP